MPWWLVLLVATAALYAALVVGLVFAGRRRDARAVAGFIPDCIVLFRRVLGDARVPRRHKVLVALLIGYLALPVDLVPDFIPVVGQLDDAIAVALVLRVLLRGGGPRLLEEHWPGPASSRAVIERLLGDAAARGLAERATGERSQPGGDRLGGLDERTRSRSARRRAPRRGSRRRWPYV